MSSMMISRFDNDLSGMGNPVTGDNVPPSFFLPTMSIEHGYLRVTNLRQDSGSGRVRTVYSTLIIKKKIIKLYK